MKKEKNPILVFFCILVLLSFIVLPPLFRRVIPKQIEVVNKNKIMLLKCTKIDNTNLLMATITSKYINSKIKQTTIKFEKVEPTNGTTTTTGSLKETYDKLNTINDIEKEVKDKETIFILNDVDTENEHLKKYYQNIDILKTNLEKENYMCNVIEG